MTDKAAPVAPVNDITEIAIIMDRSGSMSNIRDDMEGGLWTTITEQHGLPGRCRVSLYQFDDVWEPVFEGKPSGEVTREDCLLTPRNRTALFDAVVKSLSSLETRILKEPEEERPGTVVVVVITDGRNNASRENTKEDANKAIARLEEKYDWGFLYLGANKGAFEEGGSMLRGTKGVAYQYASSNVRGMSKAYSAAIGRKRAGHALTIDPADASDDTDSTSGEDPKVH